MPFSFEHNHIAILERVQSAAIRAGGNDVSGLKRENRSDVLDAAFNLVSHIIRVEVLLQIAVIAQLNLKILRVWNLIGCNGVRSDRCKRIA